MIDDTDHELLSAYVDGEVTSDERQRVERLLAESAEFRQVFEELRALRASLSSLPRHKLEEDLGRHVIRMAQQVTLGKAKMPGELVAVAAGEAADAGSRSAADRRSRAWRAIIYPILAVAAAVAMMIHSPEKKHKGEVQIAHAPAKQGPASMSAAPREAADAESIAEDEALLRQEGGSAGGFVLDETIADKQAGGHPTLLTEDDRSAPTGGVKAMAKPSAVTVPAAPPALVAGGGDRKAKRMESGQTMLIVTCTLAPAAVVDKAFDALLTRNHLVPRVAPELAGGTSSKAGKTAPATTSALAAAEQSKKQSPPADQATNDLSLGGKDRWTKSVVVELDAQQLVAVLADLQSHPEQFLSVEFPTQPAEEPQPTAKVAAAAEPGPESAAYFFSLSLQSASAGSPGRLIVLFRLSAAAGD